MKKIKFHKIYSISDLSSGNISLLIVSYAYPFDSRIIYRSHLASQLNLVAKKKGA
jgi:hypothetical protein